MEKPLLPSWVGLEVGWGGPLGNQQGGAYHVSQVDGDSDTVPPLCARQGSEKVQWPLPTVLSGKLSPNSRLDARHFSSSLCATGALQGSDPVLELRGSDSE